MLVPCLALYGVFRSIPVLVLLPMVEAVAQAATVPASQAAMAAACPPGRAAAGQGLATSAQLAGAALAALLAAPVYEDQGPGSCLPGRQPSSPRWPWRHGPSRPPPTAPRPGARARTVAQRRRSMIIAMP